MGDAKSIIERGIEVWNAHDRDGLMALADEHVEIEGPGGLRLSGSAGWREFYDTWNEAFPDNTRRDPAETGVRRMPCASVGPPFSRRRGQC